MSGFHHVDTSDDKYNIMCRKREPTHTPHTPIKFWMNRETLTGTGNIVFVLQLITNSRKLYCKGSKTKGATLFFYRCCPVYAQKRTKTNRIEILPLLATGSKANFSQEIWPFCLFAEILWRVYNNDGPNIQILNVVLDQYLICKWKLSN